MRREVRMKHLCCSLSERHRWPARGFPHRCGGAWGAFIINIWMWSGVGGVGGVGICEGGVQWGEIQRWIEEMERWKGKETEIQRLRIVCIEQMWRHKRRKLKKWIEGVQKDTEKEIKAVFTDKLHLQNFPEVFQRSLICKPKCPQHFHQASCIDFISSYLVRCV